jgi:hypothetical protein
MKRAAALAAILITVLLASLVAGCGGDDESTTTSAPAPQGPLGGGAPASTQELPPEFVRCMAERGYDVSSSDDMHSAPPAALQVCFGALHG